MTFGKGDKICTGNIRFWTNIGWEIAILLLCLFRICNFDRKTNKHLDVYVS